MRPKIMPCHNIARSLRYNEQKVEQGKAECILAGNFLKDVSQLEFEDKLYRFWRRMDLNERVTTNLHITLNFDPSDKLSNEQMKKIARFYMKELGFEWQPYLVYRHNDAGHPHCHIVTTHVLPNGDPMDLYNIGRNQSEKARQLIEAEFGLVTAEMKQQAREQSQKIDGVSKITYGEGSTSQSISRVLEYVTKHYKYTSLQDFNAILRLYRLEAYRGREDSQLYLHRGLLYRVLDQYGKYIGVPLKASFFDCKPTLDNLEKQFVLNQTEKLAHKVSTSCTVHWALWHNQPDFHELHSKLVEERICMVLQYDKQGRCKDVNYVDFRHKCVYNGDELGKSCNRQAIQEVLDRKKTQKEEQSLRQSEKQVLRHRHSLHL